MALVPCDSCRRHVRAGEAACPFCKAVRNVTTVAVVAASALAIAGCDTFSPASKYGGPPGYVYTPPDAETPTTTTEPSDAAVAPEPSTTASSPRLGEPGPDPTSSAGPKAPVAIYGGPPRR